MTVSAAKTISFTESVEYMVPSAHPNWLMISSAIFAQLVIVRLTDIHTTLAYVRHLWQQDESMHSMWVTWPKNKTNTLFIVCYYELAGIVTSVNIV